MFSKHECERSCQCEYTPMGARRIFFLGCMGKLGVWEKEVPERGPGAEPRLESGSKPPEDDMFCK